jgi:hypothetical protein
LQEGRGYKAWRRGGKKRNVKNLQTFVEEGKSFLELYKKPNVVRYQHSQIASKSTVI